MRLNAGLRSPGESGSAIAAASFIVSEILRIEEWHTGLSSNQIGICHGPCHYHLVLAMVTFFHSPWTFLLLRGQALGDFDRENVKPSTTSFQKIPELFICWDRIRVEVHFRFLAGKQTIIIAIFS